MKKDYKRWLTSEEVQEILEKYPNTKAADIATEYNIPISKVYSTAKRYEIKKSPEFLASEKSGRIKKGQRLSKSSEFKKGIASPRKGKKMLFKSKNQEKKSSANRFKKGQKPHNTGKEGEVRWRRGLGYYFIKLSDNNWELYHRWLWEQNYGKIAEDFNVVYKDQNSKNCKIENLECVSNCELMKRNTIHRFPAELICEIKKVSKIRKTIKKLSNE